MPNFVHLHTHSDYSLLDGAQTVSSIVKKAKEFGMPAVAITDHGNMSASYSLLEAAAKNGIKGIVGCEFYVAPGKYTEKNAAHPHKIGYHLVCLAESYEGYINMCHLNEEAWIRGYYYKPRINKDLLRKYHKGIICLSACIAGEIPRMLLDNRPAEAEASLLEYAEIFGKDNFFIELQDHGLPEQKRTNPLLIELARKHGLGLVVTNDSHYLLKEHAAAQDVYLCIGTGSTIQDAKRFRFPNDEFYFKSPDEMAALFPDLPEAMENTVKIAERCNVHLPTVNDTPKANHYPEVEPPEGFATKEDYLRSVAIEGLEWRYHFKFDEVKDNPTPEQKVIIERMDYELNTIAKMGFTSYYLIVWDFLHYAAKIGVPLGPGRGSGAGSIVAYLVGITHIDPIKYNLLFERFLNPERVSPPDFDIDLCERRRHEVIEYVRKKYGEPNVTQIGTFGTLKAKAVIKDVCRALGRSVEDSNSVCRLIANNPKMTLKAALEGDEKHKIDANPELKTMLETTPWLQEVWKYATVLEGMNRNMSMHAAGVIICDVPVADVVPIARAQGGDENDAVTQFPAVPCEQLGLLKMDFLGLRTLTQIQDTLDLLEKSQGIHLESNDIPEEDEKTFELIRSGRTNAVFQLESSGMKDLCRRLGVDSIKDITALVAIYRPGPMQFANDFIDRKFGRQVVEYELPEVKEVLQETYGIMLYQEQIMQVVQRVAGFSLGKADILRRAMGKKKKELMDQQEAFYMEGCRSRGVPDEISESLWKKIVKFAEYGFNKSHSAAYAVVAYRTAFLKANYPAEYMAAILTSEKSNSEKLAFYLQECHDMNINLLPPDINICDADFSVDNGAIRFGLAAIKGVGQNIVAGIVQARNESGKFSSLQDFCGRVPNVSKKLLEALIKTGAMDCFGLKRSQMFAMIDEVFAEAQQSQKDRSRGQGSLFDLLAPEDKVSAEIQPPDIPEWPMLQLIGFEKELLGFYVSGHPIDDKGDIVRTYQSCDLTALPQLENKSSFRCGAYLTGLTNKMSGPNHDRPWAILKIENQISNFEGLLFPKKYAKVMEACPDALTPNRIVFVEGIVERRDEGENGESKVTIAVDNVIPAEGICVDLTQQIHIRLNEEEIATDFAPLNKLKEICRENPGETSIIICLKCANKDVIFMENEKMTIKATWENICRLRDVFGKDAIYIKANTNPPEIFVPQYSQR